MTRTISIQLPDELSERLERIYAQTEHSMSDYLRLLIEEHIDDLEYKAGLDAEYEAIRRGEVETRGMDTLLEDFGIDPEEIRRTARAELLSETVQKH